MLANSHEERIGSVRGLVCCPSCRTPLNRNGDLVRCNTCGNDYPLAPSGQIDLRPRAPISRTVSFGVTRDPLWFDRAAMAETNTTRDPDVASLIPAPPPHERWVLEIGCGNNSLRRELEAAGWNYVGVDYGAESADFLVDVHALPFGDAMFGLVVAKALLEHVRFPHLAVQEMARVLVAGGNLIGDVAFLQPFHHSYYHMTHAAVGDLLHSAGLRLTSCANERESVFTYLARYSNLPRPAAALLVACVYPADLLYRVLTLLKKQLLRRRTDDRVYLAVGISFSATKSAPAVLTG